MSQVELLLITAISISFLHTVAGPDHYLPFIALAKARTWSLSKTIFWTVLCGCGHVLSSVTLGLTGAALGWSVSKLTWLQSIRGGWAAWAVLIFGLAYGVWGIIRSYQIRKHKHFETYDDGSMYVFEHKHRQAVLPQERHPVTPWVMFIIFLLGPCEPMIPLLFFPAVEHAPGIMVLLIMVYTFFTLAAMTLMVVLGYYGSRFIKTENMERYTHALGGLTIFICGVGMVALDW